MKIALIGPYKPTIGGVASHISSLFERLKEDHHPVRIIDVISKTNDTAPGVIYVQRNVVRLIFASIRLRFKGYRLFHFHISQKGIYIPVVALILRLLGARILLSIHSGEILAWQKNTSLLQKSILSWNIKLSHRVLFMNDDSAAKFKKLYSKSAAKFGYYDSYIQARFDVHRDREYFENGLIKIICTGLWQEYYRYEDAINLKNQIEQAGFQTELTFMVGSFAADASYREEILLQQANFTLVEDKKDPISLFAQQDILVRTSSVDSYGLSVAEAISAGTFAFATDVCVRPNGTRLFPVGDVEYLLNQITSLVESVKLNPKVSSDINLQDGYDKLMEIYQEVNK